MCLQVLEVSRFYIGVMIWHVFGMDGIHHAGTYNLEMEMFVVII